MAGPFLRTLLLVTIASVGCGCGGGELHYKLHYKEAVFTGPASKGYALMQTGEDDLGNHLELANIYVRFPDGAVFPLRTLPEKEAKRRSLRPDEEPAANLKSYLIAPHAYSGLYYREDRLVGAGLGYETEVSKQEKGPFYSFPLSEAQIRELLGEPKSKTTFRPSPTAKWN
jgi:hypothetical protein